MPNPNGPAGRLAGLTPLLVASVAVVVAAVALTVGGTARAIVVIVWIAAVAVVGSTIAVALRR